MSRPLLASLSIICALGTVSSLAVAQSPSTDGASSASGLSPQTQSALKLAGLVTFVANSCPELKPNYPRFAAALKGLGLSEADLNRMELKGRYLGYTARYNADAKASCQRAKTQFGPQGSTLPDIFQISATNVPPHQ